MITLKDIEDYLAELICSSEDTIEGRKTEDMALAISNYIEETEREKERLRNVCDLLVNPYDFGDHEVDTLTDYAE